MNKKDWQSSYINTSKLNFCWLKSVDSGSIIEIVYRQIFVISVEYVSSKKTASKFYLLILGVM